MYFDGRTANYEKEPYLEITQKDAQAFWDSRRLRIV